MEASRNLFIPVILGTARMGRMSLHAARIVSGELGKCDGVETDLIDIAKLPLPTNDAGEARQHEQGRCFSHRVAGVQPWLLRAFEACPGQLPQGIHP